MHSSAAFPIIGNKEFTNSDSFVDLTQDMMEISCVSHHYMGFAGLADVINLDVSKSANLNL